MLKFKVPSFRFKVYLDKHTTCENRTGLVVTVTAELSVSLTGNHSRDRESISRVMSEWRGNWRCKFTGGRNVLKNALLVKDFFPCNEAWPVRGGSSQNKGVTGCQVNVEKKTGIGSQVDLSF